MDYFIVKLQLNCLIVVDEKLFQWLNLFNISSVFNLGF